MNSINIFTFTGTCMPGMLSHYDAVLLCIFKVTVPWRFTNAVMHEAFGRGFC